MSDSDVVDAGNAELSDLLGQAGQAIEEFVDTLAALAERIDALQPAVDEVDTDPIEALNESLGELGERLPEADEAFQQAGQSILDEVNGAMSAVGERVHAAHANAATAVARLGDEERDLDGHFSELQAALEDTQGRIAAAYDEHLQALDAARHDLAESIARHHDEQLSAGVGQIADAVTRFASSAEGTTRQLIDVLAGAVIGLAAAVEQAVRHAEAERAPAQLALDAVRLVLDPLMAEVSRMKVLASNLGISI